MTIFGSDVSHYDAPDTRPMIDDGMVFQTHKAGGDKDDAELGSWWGYVKNERHRCLLGAYWVLYPGNPSGRADAFIARLDSQCAGWRDGPFILQVDCEEWGNDSSTVPSVSEINAFCDRLVAKLPKLCPIGYLPDWVYGDISGFRYPLWSSKYVNGSGHYKWLYPGDSSDKWAGYGGKSVTILQYSSSATIGNQTTCDANAFKGTPAELQQLLAPGWTGEGFDDMSEQDVYDGTTRALTDFFKKGPAAGYPDTSESRIGNNTFDQGIPDPHTGGKSKAYNVIKGIGTDVMLVLSTLGEMAGKDLMNVQEIVAGVLAGMAEQDGGALAIADLIKALPDEIVDEIQSRLSRPVDPGQ